MSSLRAQSIFNTVVGFNSTSLLTTQVTHCASYEGQLHHIYGESLLFRTQSNVVDRFDMKTHKK